MLKKIITNEKNSNFKIFPSINKILKSLDLTPKQVIQSKLYSLYIACYRWARTRIFPNRKKNKRLAQIGKFANGFNKEH